MEKLAELPPLAIVVFGATLAVIFAVRYLGIAAGASTAPEKSASAAQVAAVIVDPTALNRASESVLELTREVEGLKHEVRELAREIARKA